LKPKLAADPPESKAESKAESKVACAATARQANKRITPNKDYCDDT
jgi:hypothetical protein